jgi:hypothetical protein
MASEDPDAGGAVKDRAVAATGAPETNTRHRTRSAA